MKKTMGFSAVALLFVLLSCCSSFVLGGVPTTEVEQSVVVGFDPNFVDTDAETGEAVLVTRFVESLEGESVIKIEDYTDKAAWRSALWNGKVVIFIETEENGDSQMRAALSQDTRTAIKDWVRNNGGAVVFCYGDREPAQVLTGLDLSEASPEPTPGKRGELASASRTSDGDASPLFGTNSSAPTVVYDINACNPWYLGNELPARSASLKCMYGTRDECYLWRYADGNGAWYGVCPDFYDWGYGEEAQDGGWQAVMEIIIGSADPTQTSSGAQLTHWVQWLATDEKDN
ncbi:uncharacterized protein ACA1_374500 [Acanthamoeba castellanii str. Neff]|uniref:Uncharacterized protein n=1 Tax=Acanthamoeba castellanii (strain ATCC 30010 / Neff) TaxID=1257118 RepID=L8GHA5_ACACF|nr:uncharacterized protein ACA1_374500 [Acanthamoeba castellanii str. Neff]ELR12382.1 hypothetical protein ACA1_374500 [Acanthamoeba castellanii str. Neff]